MTTRFPLFCFFLFAVGVFASATETYFELLDNEGNSVLGTITAWDQTQIVLDVQGESQTVPLAKLVHLRNLANPYGGTLASADSPRSRPQPRPQSASERRYARLRAEIEKTNEQAVKKTFPGSVIALELKDGSRLVASSFIVAKSEGICRLLEQETDLSIPLTDILAVRFAVRNLLEVINPPADWLRLAIPSTEGDKLVVGNPGSFDVYAGILHEISAETISFNVDGEVLPVPRRRVFGLVLHGEPASTVSASPLATLSLWTGTQGRISDIQLKENGLSWQTSAGLSVTVPLEMVNEINFGEQGIVSLFDCKRVRHEFSLPFAPDIKLEQGNLLQTFYESRTKVSREVILDGVAYEQGVTLKGNAVLEYRLPKMFAVLKGVIGIEDQFRPHASASLQILADSQVLGTWELYGDASSLPIHLNLPKNCRLLTIIAEPLSPSSLPTVLTIAEAKLFE